MAFSAASSASANYQKFTTYQERRTAEQVLMASMQKLDQGKKSRTGMELQRGLLIAFTALRARHILWQPTPPPTPPSPPPEQFESLPVDYPCCPPPPPSSHESMLANITAPNNPPGEDDLWGNAEEQADEELEMDSDSDDMDMDQFEPIFPPLIFPEDQSPFSQPLSAQPIMPPPAPCGKSNIC